MDTFVSAGSSAKSTSKDAGPAHGIISPRLLSPATPSKSRSRKMVQSIALAASAVLTFAAVSSAWQHGPPSKHPTLPFGPYQTTTVYECSGTSKTSAPASASSGVSSTSTFLIPTATTANPVATGISIDGGSEYINYTTVGGFFLQDLTSTNASSFDYVSQVDRVNVLH